MGPDMSHGKNSITGLGGYVAACLLAGLLCFGCSDDPLDDLPDSLSHEPSDEIPTQKNSTTYEPVAGVESTEPGVSNESSEPDQRDND